MLIDKIPNLRIITQLHQNLVLIMTLGQALIRVPKGKAELQLNLCIYISILFGIDAKYKWKEYFHLPLPCVKPDATLNRKTALEFCLLAVDAD